MMLANVFLLESTRAWISTSFAFTAPDRISVDIRVIGMTTIAFR